MNPEAGMRMSYWIKMKNKHEIFMQEALKEAKKAYNKDEVPVGAVVVYEDKIIARAHNLRESKQRISAHAELLVLEKAAKYLNSWRLEDCSLYVTLEPCPMCTGAMIQSRIAHLYFGAKEPKAGAVLSVVSLLDETFNHRIVYEGGLCANESTQLLKDFFKKLRNKS